MHLSLIRFTLLLIVVLLFGLGWRQCSQMPPQPFQPCFYYWKTEMQLDKAAWQRLAGISGEQPLFLRVFDVDYSAGYGNAVPVGDLEINTSAQVSDGRPVIPVVYITNRVFEQLNDSLAILLAEKIHRRISNRLERWKTDVGWALLPYSNASAEESDRREAYCDDWLKRCNEIQIDCDWTAATRERYFRFLQAFRALAAPRLVSCTIRLHQYRDRAGSGIPPVDRGMLMCYNVADPKKIDTQNAVFDPELVKGYLRASPYPIPLDAALPVFSWGAWFRDEKLEGLLAGWDDTHTANTLLFQPEGANRFRVLQDTVIGRDYLREGDLIRLDQPDDAALLDIAELLHQRVRNRNSRLLFFDWQTEKIDRYEKVITACAARFK